MTVAAGQAPVCPACGFAGPSPSRAPVAPTAPAAPAAPAPAPAAPAPAPVPAAYAVPAPLSAAYDAMPPAPAPAARGKTVAPWLVVLLTIVTFGIYTLVFWWRTSREADGLLGRHHAHPIFRRGLFLYLAGVALALVAFLAFIGLMSGLDAARDGEGLSETLLGVGAIGLLLVLAAAGVMVAGGIMMLMGEYRTYASVHAAEASRGRPDPLNVNLYFWLPLGLALAGIIPFIGVLFSLASYVLMLTFMALLQGRLNALWGPTVA